MVRASIHAGVCGFRTQATVESQDGQHVTFQVESDCEKVRTFAERLASRQPVDAFDEISSSRGGQILRTAAECLTGCCAACVVPPGLFKAMQVAAGLALPQRATIEISGE